MFAFSFSVSASRATLAYLRISFKKEKFIHQELLVIYLPQRNQLDYFLKTTTIT